ncbi:MAG: ferrous iron transporter B, partial [Bacteroidetes bacterium]|nr:ferrous iron transporter B [Bacteroidota bacterium]
MTKSIKVALAGNPNVGKTTLLNHAAKTNLKVGNWAGVTVEKKEGFVSYRGYDIHFIDLPGIYTLEPISEDEWIAYNFIADEKPDVVVNVIETTNAERDLLLTTELLEFERPMIIALNMSDEAKKLGIEVDAEHVGELLDVPVIRTNGRNGDGVEEMLDKIVESAERPRYPRAPKYEEQLETLLDRIQTEGRDGRNDSGAHHDKLTKRALIKMLVDSDGRYEEKVRLEKLYKKGIDGIIKDERYAFARGLFDETFRKRKSRNRDITDKIDKIALHPILGFFVFLLVIFLLFKISFDFSTPFMNWTEGFIDNLLAPLALSLLSHVGAGKWLPQFFSQAIVGGVGFVITFVPLIGMIYFLLALLEMSGYMRRIAF